MRTVGNHQAVSVKVQVRHQLKFIKRLLLVRLDFHQCRACIANFIGAKVGTAASLTDRAFPEPQLM